MGTDDHISKEERQAQSDRKIADAHKSNHSLRESQKQKGSKFGKDNRYYEQDRGYDKGMYENDFKNYVKIVCAFIVFYAFNIVHFWGVFELGTNEPETGTMYNVIIFCVTIFVLIIMLISGAISNETKSKYEFLREEEDRIKQGLADKKKIEDRKKEYEKANTNAPTSINDYGRVDVDNGEDGDLAVADN